MSAMSEHDIELRQRAAEAVKQAFPVLLNDFTDQWFDHLVDVVIDTYLEGDVQVDTYAEYLRRHVDDPRRLRPEGQYTSVDETHDVIVWDGPTWSPSDGTLKPRPGTPCAELDSHLFVGGCCADCGLVYDREENP